MRHYLSVYSASPNTFSRHFEFKDTFAVCSPHHLLYLRLHTWIEIPNISSFANVFFSSLLLLFCFCLWKMYASSFWWYWTNRNAIYIIGFTPAEKVNKNWKRTAVISAPQLGKRFGYPLLSFYRRIERKKTCKQLSNSLLPIEFFSCSNILSANVHFIVYHIQDFNSWQNENYVFKIPANI